MSQRQKHLAFYGRASKSRHKKGQKLCCSVKPSAVSEINDCDVGFVPIALVTFYRIDSASVVNKKPHYNFLKQHCGHSESLLYHTPGWWCNGADLSGGRFRLRATTPQPKLGAKRYVVYHPISLSSLRIRKNKLNRNFDESYFCWTLTCKK